MEILRWLADLRTPFGNWLMGMVTRLGEEALFMLIALTVFWCIDKKRGYYLLFTGFIGTVCNQILKMIFRIPRPWVLDPEFRIVESAREQATGYSFPSGHTQIAVTLYGGLARSSKRHTVRTVCILLCVLIAFSRMYLGVHTPLDVGVSFCIGWLLVLVLYPVFDRAYSAPCKMYLLILGTLALTLGNLIFLQVFPFPANADAENLADAISVAWKMLGLILAMCILYPVDHYLIRFRVSAIWWAQILKVVLGFAFLMAVRLGLKEPLNAWLGESVGSALRYFLMVLTAGVLIPLGFRFLPEKKRKARTK